jgi:hypothetical protein
MGLPDPYAKQAELERRRLSQTLGGPSMRVILVLGFLLSGCVSVTKTVGPDGREAFVLECVEGHSHCLKKAGQLCKRGYSQYPTYPMMITCND